MTPVPHPATRTVWSEDANPARQEYRARKLHTIIVHGIASAAHLGAVGYEVQTVLREGRVVWRVPVEAKPALRRFEATRKALDNGRTRIAELNVAAGARTDDHHS